MQYETVATDCFYCQKIKMEWKVAVPQLYVMVKFGWRISFLEDTNVTDK